MSKEAERDSLVGHLEHLAADAEDIKAFLTRAHDENGDIHPEALGKSERLVARLRDVIDALTHHEHLAMKSDDVWKLLTAKHEERDDGIVS